MWVQYFVYLLLILALGFVFGKLLYNATPKSRSNIEQVGERQWIINGKYIDHEADELKAKRDQELEDFRIFSRYKLDRFKADRSRVGDEFLAFIEFERKYPEDLPDISKEDLDAPHEKYDQYKKMCDKLGKDLMWSLTKKEFLQKERCESCLIHPITSFNMLNPPYGYTFYDYETAKYADGNLVEMMEKEFEEKWY